MFPKILTNMYWKNLKAALLILIINDVPFICDHNSSKSAKENDQRVKPIISNEKDKSESNSKPNSR